MDKRVNNYIELFFEEIPYSDRNNKIKEEIK